MPFITQPAAAPVVAKRKRPEELPFYKCVHTVQFNVAIGKDRSRYMTPRARIDTYNCDTASTIVVNDEVEGVLAFVLCPDTVRECMMYENDIHVELVDGATGARKTIPRGVGFCGFQAPPIRLCFGEEYVFAIRYTNAFTDQELRRVTLKCVAAHVASRTPYSKPGD